MSKEIKVITKGSDEFPSLLLSLDRPPESLFVRGVGFDLSNLAFYLSVIGSRGGNEEVIPSIRSFLEGFTTIFSDQAGPFHLVLVSGLALGVDILAHHVALERDVPTTGVLPSNIDRATSQETAATATDILSKDEPGNAVVSLFGPVKKGYPKKHEPLKRNPVTTGLGQHVLVAGTDARKKIYRKKDGSPYGIGAVRAAYEAHQNGRQVLVIEGTVLQEVQDFLVESAGAIVVATPQQAFDVLFSNR